MNAGKPQPGNGQAQPQLVTPPVIIRMEPVGIQVQPNPETKQVLMTFDLVAGAATVILDADRDADQLPDLIRDAVKSARTGIVPVKRMPSGKGITGFKR